MHRCHKFLIKKGHAEYYLFGFLKLYIMTNIWCYLEAKKALRWWCRPFFTIKLK